MPTYQRFTTMGHWMVVSAHLIFLSNFLGMVDISLGFDAISELFKCPTGVLIWNHKLCDGVANCPGGADEDPVTCHRMTFVKGFKMSGRIVCNQNARHVQYVRLTAWCDGYIDCQTGEDEANCGSPKSLGHPPLMRPILDPGREWTFIIKEPLPRDGIIEFVELYISSRRRIAQIYVDFYIPASNLECDFTLVWTELFTGLTYGENKIAINQKVSAGYRIGFTWLRNMLVPFSISDHGDVGEDFYCNAPSSHHRIGHAYQYRRKFHMPRVYSFRATYSTDHGDPGAECLSAFCTKPTNYARCSYRNTESCDGQADWTFITKNAKPQSRCTWPTPENMNETCSLQQCAGSYLCTLSAMCIPLHQLCNGVYDCRLGEDETNCITCPDMCSCDSGEVDCSSLRLVDPPDIPAKSRGLDFSNNTISNIYLTSRFHVLLFVNLSNNLLDHCPIRKTIPLLRVLDISNNRIKKLGKGCVNGMKYLKLFSVVGNPIRAIEPDFLLVSKNMFLAGLDMQVSDSQYVCCEDWLVYPGKCKDIAFYTSCTGAKGLQGHQRLLGWIWFMGCLMLITNATHYVLEFLKRREGHLRFIFVSNMPLVGMGYGIYSIMVSIAASAHGNFQDNMWPRPWMDTLLCKGLLWLAVVLHVANLVSILLATVYNYLLTYIHLSNFNQSLHKMFALNICMIAVLPCLVGVIAVAVPSLSREFRSIPEEACNPIKILLYFPPNMQFRDSGVVTFTVIIFIALTLGTLCVVVCSFFFSLFKCFAEVMRDEDDTVDHHHDHHHDHDHRHGPHIAADFSAGIMFSLMCDFACWLAILSVFIKHLTMPALSSWNQYNYLVTTLILVPLPRAINPWFFILAGLSHCIHTHRAMAHVVKGQKNSKLMKTMLSQQPNRKYEKLTTFLKKGGRFTPYEIYLMAKALSNTMLDYHKEGMVCDAMDADYIIVCLDEKDRLKQTEVVATTEYPKWDVHEWRKQRDISLMGEILGIAIKSIAPAITKKRIATRGLSFKSFSMKMS